MSCLSPTNWTAVPGWFSDNDAEALNALMETLDNGASTAHVGCFYGRHLAACADLIVAKKLRVLAVDSWLGSPGAQNESGDWPSVRAEFGRTMDAHGLRPDIAVGDSNRVADLLLESKRLGPFALIFLDADHSYGGVYRDIALWRRLLAPDGCLCGHDYGNETFPGVRKAVDELLPGARCDGGSIWSWRKA